MGKRISFVGLSIFLLIAFTNCSKSGFKVVDDARVVDTTNLSSQCMAKIRDEVRTEPFDVASVCGDSANYQCDQRIFRLGAGHGQRDDRACVLIAGWGEACVPLKVFSFDTSDQRASSEERHFAEGGSYNRDEFTCFNRKIKNRNVAIFEAEGRDVAEALEKTIFKCRQGSYP